MDTAAKAVASDEPENFKAPGRDAQQIGTLDFNVEEEVNSPSMGMDEEIHANQPPPSFKVMRIVDDIDEAYDHDLIFIKEEIQEHFSDIYLPPHVHQLITNFFHYVRTRGTNYFKVY